MKLLGILLFAWLFGTAFVGSMVVGMYALGTLGIGDFRLFYGPASHIKAQCAKELQP